MYKSVQSWLHHKLHDSAYTWVFCPKDGKVPQCVGRFEVNLDMMVTEDPMMVTKVLICVCRVSEHLNAEASVLFIVSCTVQEGLVCLL